MGYRSVWIAVNGKSSAEVLDKLGLVSSQQSCDFLDVGLWGVQLGDWYVVCGSGRDFMGELGSDDAIELSDTGAVYFVGDDSSMTGLCTFSLAGERMWSVRYSGSEGIGKPETWGETPGWLDEVVASVAKQQEGVEDVDYMYEAPILAGERLCGFRHDDMPLPDGVEYASLARP